MDLIERCIQTEKDEYRKHGIILKFMGELKFGQYGRDQVGTRIECNA